MRLPRPLPKPAAAEPDGRAYLPVCARAVAGGTCGRRAYRVGQAVEHTSNTAIPKKLTLLGVEITKGPPLLVRPPADFRRRICFVAGRQS